ncbi:MAG: beta-lactamase family protein [Chitinophagaceae bacterium]|nr:beta-lactamase family protein [Chitinophagaceae bacterium]HMN31941.1 serine hydrolase domain-containing protein [Chitinophagaceae bacterium]
MKTYFTLLLFVFLGQNGNAQFDSLKLNEYFTQLNKHSKAMTSVCLYHNGEVIYDNSIGYLSIEQQLKANVYTQYRIGSISKMFTAVMILQMIEEKKLNLETKLNSFFPTIKNSEKITIENLLNHRSGIENFTNLDAYRLYSTTTHSEEEMITIFESLGSDFTPGTQFNYSNTNYVLLAYIIEKISKQTYAEQLLKRICTKAKLADTKVGMAIDVQNNEAASYDYQLGKWTPSSETDLSVAIGAGNIISTSRDLCAFISSLFNGILISKETLSKMTKLKDSYGYGILEFPFYDKRFYGHTGGIDGFQSILGYNEKDKLAICILGNGFNYPLNDIAMNILNAYYEKPITIPTFNENANKSNIESLNQSILGKYKNDKLGMEISIFEEGNILKAQASGQSSFPLTKVSEEEYKFDDAGIKITFIKEENIIKGFKLLQGGMSIVFEKK